MCHIRQVGYRETHFNYLLKARPECQFAIKSLLMRSDSANMSSINRDCFNSSVCRSCTKSADGIVINPKKIQEIIYQALIDRNKCIINNPFLNSVGVDKL